MSVKFMKIGYFHRFPSDYPQILEISLFSHNLKTRELQKMQLSFVALRIVIEEFGLCSFVFLGIHFEHVNLWSRKKPAVSLQLY